MKRKMIVFCAIYGLLFVGTNMVHAVTPALFQSLHYGSYMFGVAFAGMSLTNFLTSPFWGAYAGRLGYIKCFVFGVTGYTIGQLLFISAQVEWMTVAARLFGGLFVSSFMISGVLYISSIAGEKNRGRYVAYLAATQTACSAAGYFIGGMLGTVSFWAAFIAQAAACLSAAALAAIFVKEPPCEQPKEKITARALNPLRSFIDMRGVMNGFLAVFLGATLFSSFTTNCFDNSFNYYIRDQFAFPTSYNGAIKAGVGIIGLLANLTINPLLARRGNLRASIVKVFGLGALALMLLSLAKTVPAFILLAVIYYTVNAVYLPMQQTLGAEGGKGVVYGAFMSVRSLGQMTGGLLAGLLYSLRPEAPFYAAALAFLLAMALSLFNSRQKKQPG